MKSHKFGKTVIKIPGQAGDDERRQTFMKIPGQAGDDEKTDKINRHARPDRASKTKEL